MAAQTSNSERLIADGDTCLTLSPLELAQAGQPVEVGRGRPTPATIARPRDGQINEVAANRR